MRILKLATANILVLVLLFAFSGCGPKSITTDPEELSYLSKTWIPFSGNEEVTFFRITQDNDSLFFTFTGLGKQTYFENVLYMTDQSGFITQQEDYYADLERQELIFESPSTPYFFRYYLEKNKGETGTWDILRVKIADGNYYSNEMKVVIYETDNYNKGETFEYRATKNLNGLVFYDVYLWTQERRPFELYFTQTQGIVGFKVSSNELWTILQ